MKLCNLRGKKEIRITMFTNRSGGSPVKTLCVIIGLCVSVVFVLATLAYRVQKENQSGEATPAGTRSYSMADPHGLPLDIVHQFHPGMSPMEVADIVGDKNATEITPPYGYGLEQGCSIIFFWDYTDDARHGFGDPQAKELDHFWAMSRYGHMIYDSRHIGSPSDDSILSPDR